MTCLLEQPLDAFLEELQLSGYVPHYDEINARYARSELVRCSNCGGAGCFDYRGLRRERSLRPPHWDLLRISCAFRDPIATVSCRSDSRQDSYACTSVHHPDRGAGASNARAGAWLGAVHGNQEAMDRFVRVAPGVTSPAEFFSEENVGQLLALATSACPELVVRGDTTNSSEQLGRHLVSSSQITTGCTAGNRAEGDVIAA
jgi:hypothetical protein